MDWAKNSIDKLEQAKKSLGKRSGPNVLWMKEREDDSKLRVWDYNLKNGIPTLASSLNDWEEGIACLAGKPNSGKSTVLVNMMMGCLELNDDLMVIDISLDDPYKKRFEQYIACQTGLYYQEITTKTDLSETKLLLRQAAEEKLIKWYKEDKLRTIEASETEVYEDGLKLKRQYRKPEEIFRLLRSVREQYPNKKIVVFLDAWNNLDMSGHKSSSDISQANHYLGKLQEEVNELGIMFMISAHLRKMERKARPTLDDIKGTSDMQYHVVWAGIVVNELKERTLKDPLVHRVQDTLYPVLVIENVKNKVSTVDGDLMYVLNSGRCGLTPLHHVEYVEYRGIYRGARR